MIVWLDGALIPERDASISINDRGFLHADGIFETALVHSGGFFRLREHLARMHASAATMRLRVPAIRELDGIVRQVVRSNELEHANVRLTLSRGVDRPVLLVTARPPDPAWLASARAGWRILTATVRRPSVAAVPAQLKALGRTYALLARQEAADAGVSDVLLLDDAGNICEGPTWNVFWRLDRTLYTPALETGVLAGVTRGVLVATAESSGYQLVEGLFPRAHLDDAEEIFASMTSVGIVSIRELDGRSLPSSTAAADILRSHYLRILAEEAATDPVG